MKTPKTIREWVIQGNYCYGDGWEDENTENTAHDCRRSLREYRCNGSGQYRAIVRRVKNPAYEVTL